MPLHQFDIVHRERRSGKCAVTMVFVIEDEHDPHPRMLRKTFVVPVRCDAQDEEIDRQARVEAIKFLQRKLKELDVKG